MVVIGLAAEVLGNAGLSAGHHGSRKVAWMNKKKQNESHRCSRHSCEQRVRKRMPKDAARVFLVADGGQCGDDGQHDGGHGEKLKKTGVDRGDERHQRVEPAQAEKTQRATHDECAYPQRELSAIVGNAIVYFLIVIHINILICNRQTYVCPVYYGSVLTPKSQRMYQPDTSSVDG